jgi:hypothetical protein
MDPFAGDITNPLSLHKYGYGNGNPILNIDPTGMFSLNEQLLVTGVRTTLLAMNIYGAVSGARATAQSLHRFIGAIRSGSEVAAAAYAFETLVNAGLTALSVFGIGKFLSRPPGFSGGLSLAVSTEGSIQLFWRTVIASNPAVTTWLAAELIPAIGSLAVFSTGGVQFGMFPDPPGRSGRPTNGILDTGDDFVELKSGRNGPAQQFSGQPGFDAYTPTHVEGHAAAYMRLKNISYAVLRINNAICPNCLRNLSRMLGEGRVLKVVDNAGKETVFVGNP